LSLEELQRLLNPPRQTLRQAVDERVMAWFLPSTASQRTALAAEARTYAPTPRFVDPSARNNLEWGPGPHSSCGGAYQQRHTLRWRFHRWLESIGPRS
jgi:hypothetical protein